VSDPHVLVVIVRNAGSVLMHAHDGCIDHLHRRVMTGGQRIHDPIPDASLPPTNEAVVAVERTGPRVFQPKAKIQFFPGRKKSGRSSASCLSEKSAFGLGILYELHSMHAHFTA
jgi:hypothetical protein